MSLILPPPDSLGSAQLLIEKNPPPWPSLSSLGRLGIQHYWPWELPTPFGMYRSECEVIEWPGQGDAVGFVRKTSERICASGMSAKNLGGTANMERGD
jgi:hypothetical protein